MRKIFETRVLHDGWEMDNAAWVQEDAGGVFHLRTTNNGAECEMTEADLTRKIIETDASLRGLLKAAGMIKGTIQSNHFDLTDIDKEPTDAQLSGLVGAALEGVFARARIAEEILHFESNSEKKNEQDIVYRLHKRAEIRRQIPSRKSVQEGARDRMADLMDEAAIEIERLRGNLTGARK